MREAKFKVGDRVRRVSSPVEYQGMRLHLQRPTCRSNRAIGSRHRSEAGTAERVAAGEEEGLGDGCCRGKPPRGGWPLDVTSSTAPTTDEHQRP